MKPMLYACSITAALIAIAPHAVAQDRPERYRFEQDDQGNIEGKRASCEVYAKIAQVQAQANEQYKCGYEGPRWTVDARPHFRWCRFVPRKLLGEELRERAVELQQCFDRLGDFDHDHQHRR